METKRFFTVLAALTILLNYNFSFAEEISEGYENFTISYTTYREVEVGGDIDALERFHSETMLSWDWEGDVPTVARLLEHEKLPATGVIGKNTENKQAVVLLPLDNEPVTCGRSFTWESPDAVWYFTVNEPEWEKHLIGVEHGSRYIFSADVEPALRRLDRELTIKKAKRRGKLFTENLIPVTR